MRLVSSTALSRQFYPNFGGNIEMLETLDYTASEVLTEFSARLCYASVPKFGTAPGFIQNLIDVKHLDVMEHGSAFVAFDCDIYGALYETTLRWLADQAFAHGYFIVRREEGVDARLVLGANLRTWRSFVWTLQQDPPAAWVGDDLHNLLAAVAPRFFDMRAMPLKPLQLLYADESPQSAITYYGEVAQKVTFLGGCRYREQYGYATFLLEGVSRALTHQLVRHRLGSYSQMSQRYVDLEKGGWKAVTPPAFNRNDEANAIMDECWEAIGLAYLKLRKLGIRKEDARFLLPNACESSIVVTMPFNGWEHFLDQRKAKDAQWEIRTVAVAIDAVLRNFCPAVFAQEIPF